jgi:hypothetical protein
MVAMKITRIVETHRSWIYVAVVTHTGLLLDVRALVCCPVLPEVM